MIQANCPITKVTCLEDRAQVERRGVVALPPGTQRIRVTGITPLAVDRSLQIQIDGGPKVVNARLFRFWKEQPKGGLPEDASLLQQRVQALYVQHSAAGAALSRAAVQVRFVQDARAELLRSIAESVGVGVAERDRWATELERLREEERRAQLKLHDTKLEQRHLHARLSEAQAALGSEPPVQRRTCEAEVLLEAPAAGNFAVTVRYLAPCAIWRPAYRATLRNDGECTIEAEAVVWQNTQESWDDVQLCLSTARPTLGANPPALSEDWLSLREKTQTEKQTVDVAIREEVIQTVGEGKKAAVDEMPGVDDGGEVRLLSPEGRVRLPSDGQPHRIPLFRFTAKAQVELLAAPEQSPFASLIARVENTAKDPLLAGPVDLIRTSGFVGSGQLKFTAPGETAKLSFGSEDGVRVVRQVSKTTDEAMLTGRRKTRNLVRFFASNAAPEASRIVVEERVPVSEVEAVSVKILEEKTHARPTKITPDGILRFDLKLGPRATRTLEFAYEVSASSKVQGI